MGWGSNDGICYHHHHAFKIREYLVVPEPKYAPTLGRQPSVPNRIGCTACMLATIQLYCQFGRDASEVQKVWPDWMLTSKAPMAQRREMAQRHGA